MCSMMHLAHKIRILMTALSVTFLLCTLCPATPAGEIILPGAEADGSTETTSPDTDAGNSASGYGAHTDGLSGNDDDQAFGTEPLPETEQVYEIPAGIADTLRKGTPDPGVRKMTGKERREYMEAVYKANSARQLWLNHDNVSAVFCMFDEESQSFKEYSTFYADPELYYSDDWTPGLEELRLLLYGQNSCVEDYTSSQRFVCFLNASGIPYRDPQADPVTLDEDTSDEMLLRIHAEEDVLYVVTQLTESSVLRLGLAETGTDEAEDTESFYSCLYVLDPGSSEVQEIHIYLHEAGEGASYETDVFEEGSRGDAAYGSSAGGEAAAGDAAYGYNVREVRSIRFSYDHGMSHFVETGYQGLYRHLNPEAVWDTEDLREVSVTLDPGAEAERTESLIALKGDPVSISLPEGYRLYCDESLTLPWIDNGDYVSDLSLWAAQ